MEQTTNRTLASILIGLSLLAACAPAQAVTENPALNQQLNELSAGLTAAAQTAQAIDEQVDEQSAALSTAQNGQATNQPSSTPTSTPNLTLTDAPTPILLVQATETLSPAQAQFKTLVAAGQTQQAEPTIHPTDTNPPTPTSTLTPTRTLSSFEDLQNFLSNKDESFDDCTYRIISESFEIRSLTVKRNDRLDLVKGDQVIIIRPVNLRAGPTLSDRILMTLRTDPTYHLTATPHPDATPMDTPIPTVTPDPNRIPYTIIGGPAYSDLSSDDSSADSALDGTDSVQEYSPYRVEGRKYKWWQILSPDQKTTGWIVEASACGLYYFIQPIGK